jgi:hypothetical protein
MQQQAQIQEYNASQKEIEAQQNLESAMIEESRVSRMARLFKGEQIAKMGMGGTELQGGSAMEVLGDIAYQTRMDRDITLRSGTMKGAALRAGADADRFQARWSRLYGSQLKSSYTMGAFASGIGGAANIWGAMPMGR